jgi:hypothetical protein
MSFSMPNKKSIKIVTPIYKENLNFPEKLALDFSLNQLIHIEHCFIHPNNLNIDYYSNNYPNSIFLALPFEFFLSQRHYNQLCYEVDFYNLFKDYDYLLILQTDAIISNANKLDKWLNSNFDFIGGPEEISYSYDLSTIQPFNLLKDGLHVFNFQGLNGGLSLRKIKKIILVLEEYPTLTNIFRNYAGGIGEDVFFNLMSKISKVNFLIPNEITASDFAINCKYEYWYEFNKKELPFGFHGWNRNSNDQDFIFKLLGIKYENT